METKLFFFQMGKRADAKVLYHTSLPVLFGVKKYADALWEQVTPLQHYYDVA